MACADGDYTCPNDRDIKSDTGYLRLSDCEYNTTTPVSLHPQIVLSSGYDCGFNASNCIQADGSGYYIVSPEQVGGLTDSVLQSHNFHLRFPDSVQGSDEAPQHVEGYYISPSWQGTNEPWGMRRSFEWLAATARS